MGRGGLNREGGLINFLRLKRGGLLEGGGLFERGGLIEDLRYTKGSRFLPLSMRYASLAFRTLPLLDLVSSSGMSYQSDH